MTDTSAILPLAPPEDPTGPTYDTTLRGFIARALHLGAIAFVAHPSAWDALTYWGGVARLTSTPDRAMGEPETLSGLPLVMPARYRERPVGPRGEAVREPIPESCRVPEGEVWAVCDADVLAEMGHGDLLEPVSPREIRLSGGPQDGKTHTLAEGDWPRTIRFSAVANDRWVGPMEPMAFREFDYIRTGRRDARGREVYAC